MNTFISFLFAIIPIRHSTHLSFDDGHSRILAGHNITTSRCGGLYSFGPVQPDGEGITWGSVAGSNYSNAAYANSVIIIQNRMEHGMEMIEINVGFPYSYTISKHANVY